MYQSMIRETIFDLSIFFEHSNVVLPISAKSIHYKYILEPPDVVPQLSLIVPTYLLNELVL